jgi:hypothetical protein
MGQIRVCELHRKLPGTGPGYRCFDHRCLAEAVVAASAPFEAVEAPSAGVKSYGVTQALSNGKDSTNAARQSRWRKAHPKKHAETQKARWGRRRVSTGKAGVR